MKDAAKSGRNRRAVSTRPRVLDLSKTTAEKEFVEVPQMELLPNGRALIDAIGTPERPGRLDPNTLKPEQRRAVIVFMLADGYTHNEIADRLQIERSTVAFHVRRIREQAGEEIRFTTVESIGGVVGIRFERMYERLMEEARSADDTKLRIEALREAARTLEQEIRVLQAMGVVYKEPERIKIERLVKSQYTRLEAMVLDGLHRFLTEQQIAEFARFMESKQQEVLEYHADLDT